MILSFELTRFLLKEMASKAGEWAGIPVGLEDQELIVHPSYPFAETFKKPPKEGTPPINTWFSDRLNRNVSIYEIEGVRFAQVDIGFNPVACMLGTLGASVAWDIECESNAIRKLGEMLPNHAFRAYLMTGTFLETSKRSKITYFFRKLRPTVAISFATGTSRILCALCMHPIGYYSGSWAGAMCPTDDVVAHLSLMRGDEKEFWKQANQHHPSHPQAGI